MAELFELSGKFRQGYATEDVDVFFERARSAYEGGIPADEFSADDVRRAAFQLVRGGYNTRVVDSALNRLEAAFIQRDRVDYISVNGEAEWYNQVAEDATKLYPRLLRPAGQRFSHPGGKGQKSGSLGKKGYNAAQVDELLDRLTAYFDDQAALEVSDVRFALFDTAKGEKAYREDQVDAYLGKVVEILLAVS